MTRILLARHGETDWNRQGRWQGHTDRPLTATGRRQAEALAARLAGERLDALYASDLARARDTAAAVERTVGIEAVLDPDLREVDVGDVAGLDRAEAREQYPGWFPRWWEGTDEAYPGGEPIAQLFHRAVGAFRRIEAAHPGQTVAVISHSGIIRAVVLWVLGLEPSGRRHIAPGPNGGLTVVERRGDRTVLVAFNESGHLV